MSTRVKQTQGAGKLSGVTATANVRANTQDSPRALIAAAIVAGVFGLVFYIAVGGWASLNPTRIDWLQKINDWSQHYLGWAFGRFAPWTFPFGILAELGEPVGTRIAYMDANPLLALLHRPFAGILPDPWQYIGPWMASCMILQGVFGTLLTAVIQPKDRPLDPIFACLGGLLFVAVPTLIHRIDHDTLMAQWLILGALALVLSEAPLPLSRPKTRGWMAVMLTVIAAATHPYLLAMILPLTAWALMRDVASWLPRDTAAATAAEPAKSRGRRSSKAVAGVRTRIAHSDVVHLRRTVGVAMLAQTGFLLLLGLELYAVGYVSSQDSAGSDGFGYFAADLTTFFSPMGFSRLLGDQPIHPGQSYEGFGYLGLGALGLIVLATLLELLVKRPVPLLPTLHQKWAATVVMGAAFFGLSNHIYYRSRPIYSFERFWAALEPLPAMFRSSGRFVWPLGFALIALALGVLVRLVPRRVAIAAVMLAWLIQLGDLKLPQIGERLRPGNVDALSDPHWQELASGTKHIVLLPPQFPASSRLRCGPWTFPVKWEVPPAMFAAAHHMSTNSVYTARSRPQAVHAACQQALSDLAHGTFRADALYIVDEHLAKSLALGKRPLRCFEANGRRGCVHRDHPQAHLPFLAAMDPSEETGSAALRAP